VLRGAVGALLAFVLASAPATAAPCPQVTLIADSVAGALLWDEAAAVIFSHGLTVDLSCAAAAASPARAVPPRARAHRRARST